jgi:hypothetical protein
MSENEQERELAESIVDPPCASAHGADDDDKSEYKVGKGRPPIEKQFRRGQSGNPKGRPRGRRNTKKIVEQVLEEPVSIRLGEKSRTVPMFEAIVYAQAAKAAQGDARSAEPSSFQIVLIPFCACPNSDRTRGGTVLIPTLYCPNFNFELF